MKHPEFKNLSVFLSAWFNQDYDLNGDNIYEIVAKFKESVSQSEAMEVHSDISKFLIEYKGKVGEQLQRYFELEVDPLGFSASVEDFLLDINEALLTH